MNERLEIEGDMREDVRAELEREEGWQAYEPEPLTEEMVEAHYRDWAARPREVTKTLGGNAYRGWYYLIHWKNNAGQSFTEYPETGAEWDRRAKELGWQKE